MKGLFITFEGIEGSGKSTQAKLLFEYLQRKDEKVVLTKEPGGTEAGSQIRKLILESKQVFPIAELFLFLADRNQHIQELILPAIEKGSVVICDRFYHSTFAYQIYGRQMNGGMVKQMNEFAIEGTKPDLTFLIDVPVEVGFKRKKGMGVMLDRIEVEEKNFHERIRQGYLKLAEEDKEIIVIDGMKKEEEIHREIVEYWKRWLAD
jgi:dTMP kinase